MEYRKRWLHILLLILAASVLSYAGEQQVACHSMVITKKVDLHYLLYLPEGYEDDADRDWPLIVFLHGSGERGNDLNAVKNNGIPHNIARGTNLPFIVASPQCPPEIDWTDTLMVESVGGLINDLVAKYRIDEDRIYLTGLSMGGVGTWAVGAKYYRQFAAIAPVCGYSFEERVPALRHLPVWVFHGALDTVVEPEESKYMVECLKKSDGDVTFTLYPDADHNAWTETYNNPALYDWFLCHTRRPPPRLLDLSKASAAASTGQAELAIDGDLGTRWESEHSDGHWIEIDLGEKTPLTRMTLNWETACAKVYDVLVSDDHETWTTAFAQNDGDGFVDVIPFPADTAARYIKIDCKERATQWGNSIWEIDIDDARGAE